MTQPASATELDRTAPSAEPGPAALSPTARTQIHRHPERGHSDRATLFDVLRSALVCHLGVVMGDHPLVVPVAFGVDPAGPDPGGTLYLHGSVAAGALRAAPDADICVTVTHIDGLVLARTAFHHSMNYRSAIVIGRARLVGDLAEKRHALDLVVDQAVPGRAATMRPHTRKELAATAVVALPLLEASVKQRSGGPIDDDVDVEAGIWAGVLPLRTTAGDVLPDPMVAGRPVPGDVRRRREQLA
jgi:nitroimidazol reductase NimA-like FMN-containing flavoprotein (pyridoxamine 5'-phosphate oxidase superfamily)